MANLLKRKLAKEKALEAKKNAVTDERPVPGTERPKQSENSYLAFTIQRKHDGVTHLYELVQIRVIMGVATEIRRDTGTTREIVESKIFRDLSEIVF